MIFYYRALVSCIRQFLVLLLLVASPLWASAIPQFTLSDDIHPHGLPTLHWMDTSKLATPAEAKVALVSGNLVPKHIVLPIQDASHWLAFTLTNPTNFTIPYSVYIKQPFLSIANLHYQNQLLGDSQNNWISLLNGTDIPLSQRSLKTISPAFSLALAPHQEQTDYLEIHSTFKLSRVDLQIGKIQDSYLFDLGHITLVKMFIGASLILSLINILMYFSFKDKLYLYYFAYSISLVLTVVFNNKLDLFFEFFIVDRTVLYLSFNTVIIFFSLFVGHALEVKRTLPWFNVVLKIICLLSIILAGLTLYDGKYYSYTASIFFPFAIFVLCVVIYAAIVGRTSARLLAIGIAIFLSGAVIVYLTNLGLINSNLFSNHAALFGAIIEMVLFSIVLFKRVLSLNEEKLADSLALISLNEEKLADSLTLLHMAQETDRAKSAFVNTVSHELRTPLTSIKGALGLMQAGVFDKVPEKLQSITAIAYRNTERLHHLIDEILDIERLEAGEMKFDTNMLDLSGLIQESLEANESYGTQHSVTFVSSGIEQPLFVHGDYRRLIQVMANLLSNAAKFSHQGGKVEVSLVRHNSNLRVSVKDFGCGIPESARTTLFDKFTQVDSSSQRKKGGSGLGLNIVQIIIKSHEGNVDFISEVGVGTTFYFDLPELRGRPS